jgi:periplasmic divalent cation tolerance protein
MKGAVLALSTAATEEDAEGIALALVEKRVAACVNVVPGVGSTYRWKGGVERATEVLLVIKTRAERLEDLKAALLAVHLYEVPELIAFEIGDGLSPYLEWLAASVGLYVEPARATPASRPAAASKPAARSRPVPAPGRPPGRSRPRSRR